MTPEALQKIGRDFFVTPSLTGKTEDEIRKLDRQRERMFTAYFEAFETIAFNAAFGVLKDNDHANYVVSELFQSIWKTRDSFKFDDTKSHQGYIHTSAQNKAKIKLKSLRNENTLLESSIVKDGDDGENSLGLAEKLFYNGGMASVPMKKVKTQRLYERIHLNTNVYCNKSYKINELTHTNFLLQMQTVAGNVVVTKPYTDKKICKYLIKGFTNLNEVMDKILDCQTESARELIRYNKANNISQHTDTDLNDIEALLKISDITIISSNELIEDDDPTDQTTQPSQSIVVRIKFRYRSYGRGIVVGCTYDTITVKFDSGMVKNVPKEDVSIILQENNGIICGNTIESISNAVYLSCCDEFDEMHQESMTIKKSQTVSGGDYYHGGNEVPEKLLDQVLNHEDDYFEKVKDTLRRFDDGGLLYDAIINKINYSDLAKKHHLETPGAVKTRVFRAKRRLFDSFTSAQIITKMMNGHRYTGELSYFDEAAHLLYKANYKDGLLHGQFYAFHLNASSTLRVDAWFQNGKLDCYDRDRLYANETGEFVPFNQLSPEMVKKIKPICYKEYDEDSKQIINGIYKQNREDGEFNYWKNNIIQSKIAWVSGVSTGEYTYTDGEKAGFRILPLEVDKYHFIEPLKLESILHGRIS